MPATSRREREKEQRRAAILEAAQRVFQRKGYQGTTMDEVALEAEFSKGTLYLYFSSKFELFAELSNQILSKVEDGFKNISESSESGLEKVQAMLRLWVQVSSANIRQFRLAISWIASDDKDHHLPGCVGVASHRGRVEMVLSFLASAIESGKRDGSIARDEDAYTLACQLWASMMGALLFSSRCADMASELLGKIELESFMDRCVNLLCVGIGAPSK